MSDAFPYEELQQTANTSIKDVQVTGGNFTNIGNISHNYQQKPDFYEPNLEEYFRHEPISPSQQITDKVVSILRKNRLLILGDSPNIDKARLARYWAWCLRQQESGVSSSKIAIKEWQSSSNSVIIDVILGTTKTPTIFLFTQVSPEHIGYNLSRISKAAFSTQHYVVISTDTPFVSWKLAENARTLWPELNVEELYSLDDLVEELKRKLVSEKEPSQSALLTEDTKPNAQLSIDNLSIQEVAEQLRTPDKIARFVQLFSHDKRSDKRQDVRHLIEFAQDNEQTIREWYHTSLKPREQLLALGLAFFDHLFDDQLFAALEQVVERVWQRRDPTLSALDYCDLDNLRNFFNLVETEDNASKIESRLPKQRQLLFKVAWTSHRRQILTALPVLVDLVKDSVASTPSNHQELYSTPARCQQLRVVISETLSDIGSISTLAVEDTLLQLAAEKEIQVQDVAAMAMAQWRHQDYGNDKDKKLFDMLDNWESEVRIISLVNSKLKERVQEKSGEPEDYIGATIALTVGYAALYDAPQDNSQKSPGLAPELFILLKRLSDHPSPLVRDRFCKGTLPLVVPRHLVQLRGLLRKWTSYDNLILAIAVSLALAYPENPEEVLKILTNWYDKCVQNRPQYVNAAQTTKRERLLATVALTYGEIRYDEGIGTLTTDDVFDCLSKILAEEGHPFVREAVITAICNQTRQSYEQIEPHLQTLFAKLTDSERNEIVETLTEIYLKQRKELKDGDNFIEVNEVRYQIWIDPSKRPLTSIEKVMLRWLKDEGNSTAQQVATWASVNFAQVLEQEEERRIREIKERRGLTEVDTPAVFVCPIIRNEPRRGFYLGRFVPWVSTLTLNAEDYKQIISNLIPEAWKQHNFRRAAMSFVLNKWQRYKYDDDDIKNISDLLRMSLWLAEHRIQIMTLCICIGSLIWVGIIGFKKGKYFYVSTSENTIKSSVVRIYKPKSVIRKPKVTGVAQKPKTTKILNMTKEVSKKQR